MTIQVYPFSDQEEKDLLNFLKSRHYSYKSADDNDIIDKDFLTAYNKEIDDSEAQISSGNFVSHGDVKKFFANKKKRISGN